MNRRSFLSGLAALFAAPAVPRLPAPAPIVPPVAATLLQQHVGPAIFKGGILKIAIKVKGWEMPGGWKAYVKDVR